ncbi:MAG: hypothetical protein IJV11_05825 [Muribaculaceae bacterium]|nr:hypothetical protein [Muribaculaceae bacterium]
MITSTGYEELRDVMAYLEQAPFDVTRKSLYSSAELYEGYCPDDESSYQSCYDYKIYQRYCSLGQHARNVKELLARALHDHCIHAALARFFKEYDHRRCVGILGGHALSRTDKMFGEIALLCQRLTREGFVMLSGGGPGAMEAAHLGAWMAEHTPQDLADAIKSMMIAPSYRDDGWLRTAFQVMKQYPQSRYVSLGIPTWLYGHEPSTPFATHIAKFFENSIREDNILTLAFGGTIYAPGSAGTLQEIFQEAVQDHYLSYGFASPMIFLGKRFWTKEIPVYPLLEHLMKTGKYKNLLLTLTDDIDEAVATLHQFSQQHPL